MSFFREFVVGKLLAGTDVNYIEYENKPKDTDCVYSVCQLYISRTIDNVEVVLSVCAHNWVEQKKTFIGIGAHYYNLSNKKVNMRINTQFNLDGTRWHYDGEEADVYGDDEYLGALGTVMPIDIKYYDFVKESIDLYKEIFKDTNLIMFQ